MEKADEVPPLVRFALRALERRLEPPGGSIPGDAIGSAGVGTYYGPTTGQQPTTSTIRPYGDGYVIYTYP